MAKHNSLLYIKKYLKAFEGVEESVYTNSVYYKINDVKIRVSNHTKKQTKENNKYDIGIVQPINDTKQYIVIIKGSLAMNVMNLAETKEFIRNYILIKQMSKFGVVDFYEEMDFCTGPHQLEVYLKKNCKWYSKQLSENARKILRQHLSLNLDNKEILNKCLSDLQNKLQSQPEKIFNKVEIKKLIFS